MTFDKNWLRSNATVPVTQETTKDLLAEIERLTKVADRLTDDRTKMVQQESLLLAAGLRLASYRVRDPDTMEWGKLQFHMTWDNYVMAVLGEESARLLRTFLNQHLPEPEKSAEQAVA